MSSITPVRTTPQGLAGKPPIIDIRAGYRLRPLALSGALQAALRNAGLRVYRCTGHAELLKFLADCCWKHGSWIYSAAEFADKLDLGCERTVRRAIADLLALGLIERVRVGNGRGSRSRYRYFVRWRELEALGVETEIDKSGLQSDGIVTTFGGYSPEARNGILIVGDAGDSFRTASTGQRSNCPVPATTPSQRLDKLSTGGECNKDRAREFLEPEKKKSLSRVTATTNIVSRPGPAPERNGERLPSDNNRLSIALPDRISELYERYSATWPADQQRSQRQRLAAKFKTGEAWLIETALQLGIEHGGGSLNYILAIVDHPENLPLELYDEYKRRQRSAYYTARGAPIFRNVAALIEHEERERERDCNARRNAALDRLERAARYEREAVTA